MCQKPAKMQHDGKWYCGVHDPVKRKAKDAERQAAWAAQYEANKKKRALEAAAPELLAICKIFLGEDDRFQIAVGGNPIAVDKMLAEARETVTKATHQ